MRAYRDGVGGGRCRLVAVCDQEERLLAGEPGAGGNIGDDDGAPVFDPREVAAYRGAGALLGDERVDLVSVCTPTDSHVDLAIAALDAGKHVLVEKPIAIRSGDVRRLAERAAGADRLCVPAMCMRHWPGWSELIVMARSGAHGRGLGARSRGAPCDAQSVVGRR